MTLYACGSNGSGQLGIGNQDDQPEFTQVLYTNRPLIAGGGNHTLLIVDGKTLVSGTVGDIETETFIPINHPRNEKWLYGSAGWEHILLADSTTVYSLGKGTRGELGIGQQESPQLSKVWEFDTSIAQVSSGPTHNIVRLVNGELWGWGYNRQNPLGEGPKIIEKPVRLPMDGQLVACGRDYSLVLSKNTVHGWGKRADITRDEITNIYAGWSFFGLEGPESIEWHGNDAFGQTDTAPKTPKNLDQVAVGSEHGLAIKDQQVVTWGWGEHGNCPPPFPISGSAAVYGGCATSWVWVQDPAGH